MENETLTTFLDNNPAASRGDRYTSLLAHACDRNRRNTEQISHGLSAIVLSFLSLNSLLLKFESNKTSPRLIILELLNFNQCANYICLDVLDGPQIQNTKKRFRPLWTFNVTHTGGSTLWPSAKSLL